jgi:hypothetical protein
VGSYSSRASLEASETCAPLPHLVAENRSHPNHREVAIPILIGTICRILTHDPQGCAGRIGIGGENCEVVIALVPCGLNTPWVIEVEQGVRVTPVHWPGSCTRVLRAVWASRFADVAVVVTEISGRREGDGFADRVRRQVLVNSGASKEQVPGPITLPLEFVSNHPNSLISVGFADALRNKVARNLEPLFLK